MPDKRVSLAGVSSPRLDEYFGLWAIEPARGMAMLEQAARMDLAAHVRETPSPRLRDAIRALGSTRLPLPAAWDDDDAGDAEPDPGFAMAGTIAVVPVCGTLMKQQSSMGSSTSTVALQAVMRQLAADANVAGIVLTFDSPGGSVAGTADAGAAIAAAAAVKPVIGCVLDLCASAAYWLGSQCDELYANNGTALVGSIGTIVATYDYSKNCEKEGIQAKVYATGPLKGAGYPGAQITPEQDAYFQGIVDQTQTFFTAAVAGGRGMSTEAVSKLATGGVFMAQQAIEGGLLDGIKSFDQVLARMGELIAARPAVETSPGMPGGTSQENPMPDPTKPTEAGAQNKPAETTPAAVVPPPAAAAVDPKAELKRFTEAFGAANGATWYLEGKTFEQSTALHTQALAKRAEEAEAAAAKLRTENETLQARNRELRGEQAPVSANLPAEPGAKAAGKDPSALETRLGGNVARIAKGIKLPSNN
jgi:signal peptide peptidase SppA